VSIRASAGRVVAAAGRIGENALTPVALCVLNPTGAQFNQRVLQSDAGIGQPHPGGTWHRPGPAAWVRTLADPRHPFAGGIADWAFAADADGGLTLASGLSITFSDARVDGVQYTDLATDAAGTTTMAQVATVAVAEDGYVAQ
jgi:hypothetical protein